MRLLTLTGTGGVGKTRLALQIATELRHEFPDGIRLRLARLHGHDADLVLPAIAQAEGLQSSSPRPPLKLLKASLREQQRLLVLDNFETVVAAAPSFLDLLAACPYLKLLVTSREVLRVRGEREFFVQPLALPDPKHLPDDETLAHYGAVALFLERAREVQPTLQSTAVTAPLITDICRRLDGLPLALELAAARLKVLSLQALLERLEHRLAVLTVGRAICRPASRPCVRPSPGRIPCSRTRNSVSFACFPSLSTGVFWKRWRRCTASLLASAHRCWTE